jgi:hypothetical protein
MSQQIPLPWALVNGVLTISLPSGEFKSVQKSDDAKRFDDALNAIRENRWSDIPDIVCPKNKIQSFSNGHMEVIDGIVHIDGEKIPSALSARIIDYSSQDLPYEPLLLFWKNLNKNPSNRAVTRLYGFLEANRHPITPDGHFIAYRGIRGDFMDCHSGTMDNSPGQIVKMDRNKVDESENACSHGLHAANYEFAKSFGEIVIMIKVNPEDVVAIPTDYGVSKMRVCRFEVIQVVDKGSTEELYERNNENDKDEDEDDNEDLDYDNEDPDYEDNDRW